MNTRPVEVVADSANVGGSLGYQDRAASFPAVLRQRLDEYFTGPGRSPKADAAMTAKLVFGFAWILLTYVSLYTPAGSGPAFPALYILHGMGHLFLLLNLTHDSNHNAVSHRRWVNRSLSYVMDLLGINSRMWKILHHRGHHSCINIHGEDEAILARGLLRLSPAAPYQRIHRFQHFYAFPLYTLFSLDYIFIKDFEYSLTPRDPWLQKYKITSLEVVALLTGKVIYAVYMLLLPIYFGGHSWGMILAVFLMTHLILGLVSVVVFQTSHVVSTSHFPASRSEFEGHLFHVLATTADYAPANPLVAWFAGGLNLHVAHHLCPHVCHTHYGALTRIIRDTAKEFGIPYRQNETLRAALTQHIVLLHALSQDPRQAQQTGAVTA